VVSPSSKRLRLDSGTEVSLGGSRGGGFTSEGDFSEDRLQPRVGPHFIYLINQ
jgi:hypothetical protein